MKKPEPRQLKRSGGMIDLAAKREKMLARMQLQTRTRQLGSLKTLDDSEDEPLLDNPPEGLVAGINAAVDAIGAKKRGNKLSGEELEKWKANRARVKEIRERQADAEYYTCLVFDSRGQCQAFVDELAKRFVIGRDGDLFLDGRHLAAAMGIELPPPEYAMTTSVTLSQGRTKGMKKVPKGVGA